MDKTNIKTIVAVVDEELGSGYSGGTRKRAMAQLKRDLEKRDAIIPLRVRPSCSPTPCHEDGERWDGQS